MIIFAIFFSLLLGVCVFLGLPRIRRWQRITSVVSFFLLIGIVYAGSIDLLGSPQPIELEWRTPDDATVLASSMREGEAIYVWLQAANATEPRSYVLPWNTKTAQQLQNALEDGKSTGRKGRMTRPSGSDGEDGVPKFYAEPQRPLPEKDQPGGDAIVYQHPDS